MSSEPIFQRSRELLKQVELQLIFGKNDLAYINLTLREICFFSWLVESKFYNFLMRYIYFKVEFWLPLSKQSCSHKFVLFYRNICYPFLYCLFGIKKLLGKVFLKLLYWMITIILFLNIEFALSNSQEFIQLLSLNPSRILFGPLVLSIVTLIFDIPSFFTSYGIGQSEINSVIEVIKKLGFKTREDLEALTKDIESFKNNSDERVKSYQWILGAIFAIDVFYFNTGMADATRGICNLSASNLFSNIFVWLFIGYILLSIYKRANDCILQTIMYACNEYFINDIHDL